MERKVYIDYAKGIGIALVVLGHVCYYISQYSILAKWIYSFHMPLFFVITGIITYNKFTTNNYIRLSTIVKKIYHSLFIPYILWSLVYIIPPMLYKHTVNYERIYAVLSFRGVAPIWFLSALFFSQIILYFYLCSFKYSKCRNYIIVIILAIVTVATSEWYTIFRGNDYIVEYPIIFLLRVVPSVMFLLCGYEMARYINKSAKVIFSTSLLVFIIVNILSDFNVNMHLYSFSNPYMFIVSGICGSTFIVSGCVLLKENIHVLQYMGRNSLNIMAIHYYPMSVMWLAVFFSEHIFDKISLVFVFCATMIITIALDRVIAFIKKIKKC